MDDADEDFDILRVRRTFPCSTQSNLKRLSLLKSYLRHSKLTPIPLFRPTAEAASRIRLRLKQIPISKVINPENLVPKEEADFSNNPDQETSAEVADPAADPIVGSSPSVVEPDPNSTFAPVYVQHLGGVAEEDEVPPPPTSPIS